MKSKPFEWKPRACAICGRPGGILLRYTEVLVKLGKEGTRAHARCVQAEQDKLRTQ